MARDKKVQQKGTWDKFKIKKINALFLLGGVLFIVIGFILLHFGSMTLAPIILIIGYCVLIPLGIML